MTVGPGRPRSGWRSRTARRAVEAKRALETMKRMKKCPTAAEAFDQGDLSLAEADAVTVGRGVGPVGRGGPGRQGDRLA